MADLGPLSDTYGPLKGWQWVAIVGGGVGIIWYLRRNAAANAAATTSVDPTKTGNPGTGGLSTIIEQMGPPSVVVNVPGNPKPSPTPNPTKPPVLKPVNPASFPLTVLKNSALGKTMIKIGSYDKNGKYTGKQVKGGAPVYGLSTATGQFKQGPLAQAKGHDLYVPAQFASYIY